MFQKVTESLAIGNLITSEELQEIAQQGYSTLIDLCTPIESQQMKVEDVKKLGFNYINIPVSPQNLNSELLQMFSKTVNTASQPVYIRCASGLRAGVFTLLTLADQQNWTEKEYLEHHQKLGLQHKPNCPIKVFSEECFADLKSQ